MQRLAQKKIVVTFVAVLFILALVIPALYPVEDDAGRWDCPLCKVCGQLFTAATSFFPLDLALSWERSFSSHEIFFTLPKALPAAAESRAPPA